MRLWKEQIIWLLFFFLIKKSKLSSGINFGGCSSFLVLDNKPWCGGWGVGKSSECEKGRLITYLSTKCLFGSKTQAVSPA